MKILIPLAENEVAPRFDHATEVFIAEAEGTLLRGEPRTILLPAPSADELCGLAIREGVRMVVCNGIEQTHYEYLTWKKITVIDGVIGPAGEVLNRALAGALARGAIVRTAEKRGG